jgi:hypothetical protein
VKCRLCYKATSKREEYCTLHRKALENVISGFKVWRKALGVSWKEYLSKLADNPLTGEAAKEVARHLLTAGEK